MAGLYPIIDGRHQILSIYKTLRKGGPSRMNAVDESTEGEVSGVSSVKENAVTSIWRGIEK